MTISAGLKGAVMGEMLLSSYHSISARTHPDLFVKALSSSPLASSSCTSLAICGSRRSKLTGQDDRAGAGFRLGFSCGFGVMPSQHCQGPMTNLLGWDNYEVWNVRPDFSRPAVLQDDSKTEHQAAVIDGKAIAQQIKEEIAEDVARMKEAVGKVPGLAVVLVGTRKDSMTYVRSKKKACNEAGIQNFGIDLPEDVTEEEVLRHIQKYNDDPEVHGILVQLPLPRHLNEEKILGAVSVEKDVDGFNPMNLGKLAMSGREPLFVSCTPKGCIELLIRSGVEIAGKRAVVIGRSKVVGTPAAMLLQRHNATVSVVHSHTRDPAEVVRTADIVIAAVGVANLVRDDWLKPGAVVIDVGMNAVEDPSAKRGYRLVGDVCYSEAARVASAITPVPGGVGPMTIAMLLSNTLISAKRAFGQI